MVSILRPDLGLCETLFSLLSMFCICFWDPCSALLGPWSCGPATMQLAAALPVMAGLWQGVQAHWNLAPSWTEIEVDWSLGKINQLRHFPSLLDATAQCFAQTKPSWMSPTRTGRLSLSAIVICRDKLTTQINLSDRKSILNMSTFTSTPCLRTSPQS